MTSCWLCHERSGFKLMSNDSMKTSSTTLAELLCSHKDKICFKLWITHFPRVPFPLGCAFIHFHRGCALSPFTSILAKRSNLTLNPFANSLISAFVPGSCIKESHAARVNTECSWTVEKYPSTPFSSSKSKVSHYSWVSFPCFNVKLVICP